MIQLLFYQIQLFGIYENQLGDYRQMASLQHHATSAMTQKANALSQPILHEVPSMAIKKQARGTCLHSFIPLGMEKGKG
jgi:hypothetical protein